MPDYLHSYYIRIHIPIFMELICTFEGLLLNNIYQSSSSTVRKCSLCFTIYYTIHTKCFGLTYRPSSGVIYKQIQKGATDLNGPVDSKFL
jgi:hypothetical protein